MINKKGKGTNAERNLIHAFWKEGWAACRVAGSGSSQFPSPDVIAGKGRRRVAIEAKTTKDSKKYLPHEEVMQLEKFATIFGAEPWVAVKFNGKPWYFLPIHSLRKTDASFAITLEYCEVEGFSFEKFIALP